MTEADLRNQSIPLRSPSDFILRVMVIEYDRRQCVPARVDRLATTGTVAYLFPGRFQSRAPGDAGTPRKGWGDTSADGETYRGRAVGTR